MDFQLTESQRALQEMARKFAREVIRPKAAHHDETSQFPREIIMSAWENGLLNMALPEAYGGVGLSHLDQLLAYEELAWGCAGMATSITANDLANLPIMVGASEEQKQRLLRPFTEKFKLASFCLTEPEAGSDVANMSTTAVRDGDHYVLNGAKMWITNGPDANTYVIYAKTDLDKGPHGITAFIVERDWKGFSRGNKFDKLGMRGSNTCELFFDDVEVPQENVLGVENGGVKVLMSGLDYERVVLAGGPTGIMQACLDVVVPYIHDRKQFGQSIGEFQFIQGKVADMYTQLNASRAYLYAVAQACDRGETTRKDAAGVILYTAENATQMALQAIQILGGNGYINEFPTGRLLRDAKLYEIGAGTSEIRRMLIGRELFNESRWAAGGTTPNS